MNKKNSIAMNLIDKYSEIYLSLKNKYKSTDNSFMFSTRENSYNMLLENNFSKELAKRYEHSNIESVAEIDYNFIFNNDEGVNLSDLFYCQNEDLEANVIFLSNGIFLKKKIIENTIPEGVIICGMKEASQKYPSIFEKYYDSLAKNSDDKYSFLNTLFANDGLFLYIPENVRIEMPFQIINLSFGFENKNFFNRNLFIIEENSEASLIVCNHSLNNSKNFVIDISEAIVKDNSTFEYYAIQNETSNSIVNNYLFASAAKNATIKTLGLLLHGNILRNNIFVSLIGEHSFAGLYSLSLADRKQVFENYTSLIHEVPNATSNELYKNIIDENAICFFEGKIVVKKEAQKTEARQENRNICLTDHAKIFTKPQLEIYADDVVCGHGSTVGQLNGNELFYLQQRGIDYEEARQLLLFAFANDILSKIKIDTLKNKIVDMIEMRLKGQISDKCNCLLGCNL